MDRAHLDLGNREKQGLHVTCCASTLLVSSYATTSAT
jgi:hypothetical protein